LLERFQPSYYWNLKVETANPIKEALGFIKIKGGLVIGTSRLGKCVEEVSDVFTNKGILAIVFGGPRGHVWDSIDKKLFDVIVNTVPLQGVKAVRTEEAVIATLSALDRLVP
jgi:predicted SPOUT superfamily RNA methylase MTH1